MNFYTEIVLLVLTVFTRLAAVSAPIGETVQKVHLRLAY